MASKKERIEIPPSLAAEVMFHSDRTCCICHNKGKPTQIHHIDDNPSNNIFKNLAVLCFECHNETLIRGGFHRKLNAELVTLYRDKWLVAVARQRNAIFGEFENVITETQDVDLEIATSIAEIYHERNAYDLLAMHYSVIGNNEFRDKYIELAIQQGIDDEGLIFFRKEQGHMDLVPVEVKERRIRDLEEDSNWLHLGRLYRDFGEIPLSVKTTCKGIIEGIEKGRFFTAAIYLKEMIEDDVLESLFKAALDQAHEEEDLWWQYRTLQELQWYSEIDELLLKHKEEIETSGDIFLGIALARSLGDNRRYVELKKAEARMFSERVEDADEDDSNNKPQPS